MRHFICKHCGNIIELIKGDDAKLLCCNKRLNELVPNIIDASLEKHVPIVKEDSESVTVILGSIPHPMEEEHLIEWVELITNQGIQRKFLNPRDETEITFSILEDEKPKKVYAYCNLHGLWSNN